MIDVIEQLIQALRCLPGVGPKSAQRMAYYLLQHQRSRGLNLAKCLETAMISVGHCKRCNNFSMHDLCKLCCEEQRSFHTLCIVENPSDLLAIEQSGAFHGGYYVLMGKLSPLDGIGPEELKLQQLVSCVIKEEVKEIIFALSPTVEGQTTIHFIKKLLENYNLAMSQLAQGIPSGGELEYLDGYTISCALRNREGVV